MKTVNAACRYWLADSYEARHAAGQEPQNIDKEFLRLWFRDNCDPYKDEVTDISHSNVSMLCARAAPDIPSTQPTRQRAFTHPVPKEESL